MYDGAMVVTMLMRWAQRDPALARAIVGEGPNLVEAWKKTAAAYSGLRSEDDIARTAAAIRAQQRQSDEREQSLYLSRLPATEPTPSGLQYHHPRMRKGPHTRPCPDGSVLMRPLPEHFTGSCIEPMTGPEARQARRALRSVGCPARRDLSPQAK
jgi:hypothetical protein